MLCEHGNVSPCVECDIEPLRAENEKLRENVAELAEALQNMLGAFDTPIVRRKVGSVFSEEAIGSAHAVLTAYHKQGGEAGK